MNNLGIGISIKQEFTLEMPYRKVFDMYIKYKLEQYSNREDKNEYKDKPTILFHNKFYCGTSIYCKSGATISWR